MVGRPDDEELRGVTDEGDEEERARNPVRSVSVKGPARLLGERTRVDRRGAPSSWEEAKPANCDAHEAASFYTISATPHLLSIAQTFVQRMQVSAILALSLASLRRVI